MTLRIGYLVPGHFLLSSAGPTRNVLSLARALAPHAELTVAFRRSLEDTSALPFEVRELEPGCELPSGAAPLDDAAIRGRGVRDLMAYLRGLRCFAAANRFDVVLEKSWLFSGWLATQYRRHGVPGVVVENVVRQWRGSLLRPSHWPGALRHALAQYAVGAGLRSANLVIAETNELLRGLEERFALPSGKVEVVGLGVDHERFRPADEEAIAEARAALGVGPGTTLLLYVGVLDATHDLRPVLTALRQRAPADVELHVVGDGEARAELEALAGACGGRAKLHGRVPHERVPAYLAAADLCLAPYDLGAFPTRRVAYSTLKIPEAMACATPVASVPDGRPGELIRDGVSGFLLANTAQAWGELLERLPDREALARMGRAAVEDAAPLTWEATAAGYLEACERVVGARSS